MAPVSARSFGIMSGYCAGQAGITMLQQPCQACHDHLLSYICPGGREGSNERSASRETSRRPEGRQLQRRLWPLQRASMEGMRSTAPQAAVAEWLATWLVPPQGQHAQPGNQLGQQPQHGRPLPICAPATTCSCPHAADLMQPQHAPGAAAAAWGTRDRPAWRRRAACGPAPTAARALGCMWVEREG